MLGLNLFMVEKIQVISTMKLQTNLRLNLNFWSKEKDWMQEAFSKIKIDTTISKLRQSNSSKLATYLNVKSRIKNFNQLSMFMGIKKLKSSIYHS